VIEAGEESTHSGAAENRGRSRRRSSGC
jgi:hypothetical protein